MKRYKIFIILIFCSIISGAFTACDQKAPDLSKKEMDPRLIGTWMYEKSNEDTEPLIFKANGDVVGYTSPSKKKRVFYTEQNCFLYIFVEGNWLKESNWTYKDYYEIHGDTLKIWSSWEAMEDGVYEPTIYVRAK